MNDGGTAPVEFVQSLERGLAVIRAFDATHAQLTLSEVAQSTGLSRAVARRFLHTLVALGYVRTDGRVFALRPRVLDLGYAYLSSLTLPEIALPHLDRLAHQVNEACSITVLDEDDIVYVARVPSPRMMSVAIRVGTRFPAYATSTGRVLLAGRPDDWLEGYLRRVPLIPITGNTTTHVRDLHATVKRCTLDGYCLVDQELEEGVRSLAIPLHADDGTVVAAMNISAPANSQDPMKMVDRLLAPLQEAGRLVEEDFKFLPQQKDLLLR
ncbi:IclR family transcriptional regulator C-terminal domain-containing protein [Pseudonocardia yunnanensis]|uniref:IclR family transcriptional regulator C-terminal domain-containing protein n=1 Tax=Pseudonocardia yunnanensis TaxID=58107 RepID=A0ABW4F575_9PSEU